MKIFTQIIKEFWIPLALSILWVLYNIYGNGSETEWSFQKTVNIFGPTFFLLSWLTGQFFRVKKQTKVEDSFGSMEIRFKELLDKVESKTEEMIGHISDGNSFPWLQIGMTYGSNQGVLMAIHQGDHPLYDVIARIVDLQKLEQVKNNISLATLEHIETNVNIGNMIPSHASMVQKWEIESEPEQSYNIFLTARNGSFTQLLRLKKVNGAWVCATKIMNKNNEILHEQIDDNYPKEADGSVTWK
ncbi:hypothetical protein [Aeromonas dhakensis]|uniref:hypothetical protein n=1 Tax=Aeromonas dhakensis TaxID=196024 RepID=UPI0038D1BDE7